MVFNLKPARMAVACLFICAFGYLRAQDPHFSQFFANRVYLNPAFAGFDPGATLTLNYRDQWFGIPDGSSAPFTGGYRTFSASLGLQIPCLLQLEDINMGLALSCFRDEAGTAPLTTSGFGLTLSHEQPIIARQNGKHWMKRLDLRIGGQLSYMQKRLHDKYLIYSYQLDPVEGLGDDGYEELSLMSAVYPNMNAGVLLRAAVGKKKGHESLITLGISFSNINKANVALRNTAAQLDLPTRTTFYLGSSHRITRYQGVAAPWFVAPQFRWDSQMDGKLNVQTLGAYVFQKAFYGGLFLQYNLPSGPVTNSGVRGTLYSRNITALILNAGIDLRSVLDLHKPWRKRDSGIVLGLTYDVNLSGLDASDATGVLEFNLRVNFGLDKQRNCLEIGKFEHYNGKCPVRF